MRGALGVVSLTLFTGCAAVLGIEDGERDPLLGAAGAGGSSAGAAGTSAAGAPGGAAGTAQAGAGGQPGGSSGSAGDAGTAGTAGQAGASAGAGGSGGSGQAGTAGAGGDAGQSGTAGTAGAGGDAGTAGTSGAGGDAGQSGTAGTSGAGGDAGQSGGGQAGGGAGQAGGGAGGNGGAGTGGAGQAGAGGSPTTCAVPLPTQATDFMGFLDGATWSINQANDMASLVESTTGAVTMTNRPLLTTAVNYKPSPSEPVMVEALTAITTPGPDGGEVMGILLRSGRTPGATGLPTEHVFCSLDVPSGKARITVDGTDIASASFVSGAANDNVYFRATDDGQTITCLLRNNLTGAVVKLSGTSSAVHAQYAVGFTNREYTTGAHVTVLRSFVVRQAQPLATFGISFDEVSAAGGSLFPTTAQPLTATGLVNTAAWRQSYPDVRNHSIKIQASTEATVTSGGQHPGQSDFAVSVWVKRPSASYVKPLLSTRNPSTKTGWTLRLAGADIAFDLETAAGVQTVTAPLPVVTSLMAGPSRNVIAQRRAGNLELWVSGVLVSSTPLAATFDLSEAESSPLRIGLADGMACDAELDELELFNDRALTPCEVVARGVEN